MPETEPIFDEGGMAPRPESGLYGLPADEGGMPPTTPLLGSGPEEGQTAAPAQTSTEGQENRPATDEAARLEAHLRQTDALTRVLCCRSAMNWARRVVFTSDEKMNMVSSKLCSKLRKSMFAEPMALSRSSIIMVLLWSIPASKRYILIPARRHSMM